MIAFPWQIMEFDPILNMIQSDTATKSMIKYISKNFVKWKSTDKCISKYSKVNAR